MRILVAGGAGYVGSTSVEGFLDRWPRRRRLRRPVDRPRRLGHQARPPGARLGPGPGAPGEPAARRADRRRPPLRRQVAGRREHGRPGALLPPQRHRRRLHAGGDARLPASTGSSTRSTAAVYGEPRRVPIAEADRTEPINPYGATKLAFEGAMRWFAASHDFQAISLRYFNVAGATERNGEDHEPETHLMPGGAAGGRRRGDATSRSSARTTRRPTAPASATSSTSATWPLRHLLRAGGDRRGRSVARGLQPRLGGRLQRARGRRGRPQGDRPRHPGPRAEAPHRRPAGAGRLVAPRAPRAGLAAPSTRKLEQMLADAWAWRMAHPARLRPSCRDRRRGHDAGRGRGRRRGRVRAGGRRCRDRCGGSLARLLGRLRGLSPRRHPRGRSWRSARRSPAARRR